MKLRASNHLTDGYPETLARQIRKTHVGMASWASGGPLGTSCNECEFYGTRKQTRDAAGRVVKTTFLSGRCDMFKTLTGKIGAVVPANAESCRHFTHKDEVSA